MFVGPNILHRMVADRLGLSLAEVDSVLAAYTKAVLSFVELGQPVRILGGLGYLKTIKTKARTVTSPIAGLVEVPEKQKIVFRVSKRKDEAEKARAKARLKQRAA